MVGLGEGERVSMMFKMVFKGRDRGQKWRVPLKPDVRKFVTWVANCSRYVAPSALPNDKSSQ